MKAAPGLHYCLECRQKYCEGCKGLHKKQNSSKNHTFQLATKAIPEEGLRCKDHEEQLSLFCSRCDASVCSSCIAGKHNGHEFSKIEDFVEQIQEQNTKTLQSKTEELDRNLKQISSGLQKYQGDAKSVIRCLEEEGVRMKTLIDNCVNESIKSVKEVAKQESKKLELAIIEIKSEIKLIQELDKTRRELQKCRADAALVEKLQGYQIKIDKLRTLAMPEVPASLTFIKSESNKEEDVRKLLGTSNIGLVISELI